MNSTKLLAISTAVVSIALVASLGVGWKIHRDMRNEMRVLSDANGILRQTLGDLTTAITAKQKEIDSLSHSPCGRSEPWQPSTRQPQSSNGTAKTSGAGQIGAR